MNPGGVVIHNLIGQLLLANFFPQTSRASSMFSVVAIINSCCLLLICLARCKKIPCVKKFHV